MKKRLGDRRSRPRFDVVGSLMGQVEIWRQFEVHNLGSGGALVESTFALSPGTRLGGRVSAPGGQCEVRAHVRHARRVTHDHAGRYLVGLEWTDRSAPIEELMAAVHVEAAPGATDASYVGPTFRSGEGEGMKSGLDDIKVTGQAMESDRRKSPRLPAPDGCHVSLCVNSPVGVLDLSASGLLFSSKFTIEPGAKAQLRLRLGDEEFSSAIEVRRRAGVAGTEWRMGAAFVLLDDVSRRSLDALLPTKH